MSSVLEGLMATQIPDAVLFDHLRLDPEYASDEDKDAARRYCRAALSYVEERCGIDDKYADEHPDIAVAVLALARDMYDNRSMTVDKAVCNPTAESILAVHSYNLLA